MSFIIPNDIPTKEFSECWFAAGKHLNEMLRRHDRPSPVGPFFIWLRDNLNPPFLEHLSFRLGNQLFFIRIEDVSGFVCGPGNVNGLFEAAQNRQGHACILPMQNVSGKWLPQYDGWGLRDARTQERVDPPSLVTELPITMSDWEVHSVAIQFVRLGLKRERRKIISSQDNPAVYPTIWFELADGVPAWILIKGVRFPDDPTTVEKPSNWAQIGIDSAHLVLKMNPHQPVETGTRGYFIPVGIARSDETFREDPKPLLRGHAMISNFSGLEGRQFDLTVLMNRFN